MTCIKYIIFFVNFLFFVVGVAAMALGIYALVDKDDMEILTMIDSQGKLEEFNAVGLLQKGAIVVISVGTGLLVLGFLGCCGAIKESRCLLGLYSGIVIVIVIIQIVAAGIAIAFRERISVYLQNGLKGALTQYYDGTRNSSNAFSRAFDVAQIYFECCGVMSADDFNDTQWYASRPSDNMTVPVTCCRLVDRQAFFDDNKIQLQDPQCPLKKPATNNPYTAEPCYYKIKDWIFNKAAIIIGIALGIIVIEIVAIVMACRLYSAIDN